VGSETGSASGRESPHSPSRSRIWLWTGLLVLLAAGLISQLGRVAAGAPAGSEIRTGPVPSGLDAALTALFDPQHCITSAVAQQEVRELLDRRGLGDWTITSVATDERDCVGWSMAFISETPRTVALIPVLSPEVIAALAAIREDSYQRCFAKNDLIELVRSRLAALGQRGLDVRDDGPVQVPLDREKEILNHVQGRVLGVLDLRPDGRSVRVLRRWPDLACHGLAVGRGSRGSRAESMLRV
jgi:hypothetical protein